MSQELYQAADMCRKGTGFKQGKSSNNMCVSVERKKQTFRKIVNCFHYTKPVWEFATGDIGVIICTNLGKSHTVCGTFLKIDQNIRLWSVYCILIAEGEYNGNKFHEWRSCS